MTTFVMLVIFTSMSVMALGFPTKAGFMPLLVGIPGALLCAVQLFIDLRGGSADEGPAADAEDTAEQIAAPYERSREIFMFGWLAAFTVGLFLFGFLIGGPITVFLYLKFGERESWFSSLLAAAATCVILYATFIWLLELSIFQGFILERLIG